jgi:Rod binding domain-containing protein
MHTVAKVANSSPLEVTRHLRFEKAAHEFEAQLMKEILRPMSGGDDESEPSSSGALADFASEALGQALSRQGGFGIAGRILQTLSQNGNEAQDCAASRKDINNSVMGLK